MSPDRIPQPIMSWPQSSPIQAFAARRSQLRSQLAGPVVFASGSLQPRNYPDNPYPFRAQSHFLYLVGAPIPDALLWLAPDTERLYLPDPNPAAVLWDGPQPSLANWAERLGIEVRPLSQLPSPKKLPTLPPADAKTAAWLSSLLERPVACGQLSDKDAELADAMIEQRLTHDAASLAQTRQAIAVTAQAHVAGMAASRPRDREAITRAAMDARLIANGMTHAYAPIVTVCGEVLHDARYDRCLTNDALVLADVGAETPEGWAADVTRTWPAKGSFSSTQRDLYQVVLDAQLAAIHDVCPGAEYRDVHHTARRQLVAGLIELGILKGSLDELHELGASALFFPHGVGHLLGLDVHDMEDLGDRAGYAPGRHRHPNPAERFLRLDRTLVPGMVVTIEPGFYRVEHLLEPASDWSRYVDHARLAQFDDVRGIRIEDDLLVTETGCEVLSQAVPKTITDVEAACQATAAVPW